MVNFIITTITLILWQLLLPLDAFVFNPVPDLVKVRRRDDAKDAEFIALDFIGLVERDGRTAEEHNITTKDGYKLKIFRVPPNPSTTQQSKPNRVIFVQHGLSSSADNYVVFGPGRSIVYLLSDAGYDVWLGNVRGSPYGREHVTLSPDQAAFWDFSLDEYSTIDLPGMIDYTTAYTGQKKITYIGHSLGTTMMLMLLAEQPEYMQKLDLLVYFAPVAYWVTKTPVRILYPMIGRIIQKLFDPRGTTELFRQSSLPSALFTRVCSPNRITDLCWLPVAWAIGHDPEQTTVDEIWSHNTYPAGSSAKALYHYRQHAQTSKFRKYDYENVSMNMKHYGQPEPPDYDLSNVNVPTVIFHAQNDPLSTVADTKALISHLHPNTSILYQVVPYKYFTHLDFVTAKDVKRLVYDRLMEILIFFHKNEFDNNTNALY